MVFDGIFAPQRLLDELGDLLFQAYFLALLLSERGAGDLEQVARGIHAKLVARHPHVFGEDSARDAKDVLRIWGEAKAAEKKQKGEAAQTLLGGVPRALPALVEAQQIAVDDQ